MIALISASCTDDALVSYKKDGLHITGGIISESRTSFVQGDGFIETHWKINDAIGLFSENQSNHLRYEAIDEGLFSTFRPTGNDLENKEGQKVYAYYPFDGVTNGVVKGDNVKLPSLKMVVQDNFYPFLYSQGQINGGELNFQFKHLFAYLKIKISVQNIKEAFAAFNQNEYVIEDGEIALLRLKEPLTTEDASFNVKTNEFTGTFSDRIRIRLGKNIDFNSNNVYTYMVPILPVSSGTDIGIGFAFKHKKGGIGTKYNMYYKSLPEKGFKAGYIYNWDLTDNQTASEELYEALESFYYNTQGNLWYHNDNWLSDKPLGEWYGINEGPFKYRTLRRLSLKGQNLKGKFPEEIKVFMDTAEDIDLSDNYLTGPIPEEVKNHKKWGKLGWKMIQQFQTREGQLDLNNSNLYVDDVDLDFLFAEETQQDLTLHEFIKENKLTQIFRAYDNSENQSFEDVLKYINEKRINQHLDYQEKGLKSLIFISSVYNSKDWLKKQIIENYGDLKGVEWVYGTVPIKSFYIHNSYLFDSNSQLVYNANYNIGCPTWDNDCVHDKLSQFLREQLGEPTEHPEFSFGLTSTDYSKDGDVFVIQKATKGNGINMVFLGEGYIDKEMDANGLYERTMKEAADKLFSIEPYKSFRDRFNLYGVKVVSPNSGILVDAEHGIDEDNSVCFDYAQKIPDANKQSPMVTVIYHNFTWGDSGTGRSYTAMYADGSYVAYLFHGVEDENTLIHESGGHGFANLLDEYVEPGNEQLTLPEEKKSYLDNVWTNYSWGANVDWCNDASTIKWSHFLNDSRYANEGLGLYEGAYLYGHGAYRSTENSMMRYNDSPFNAPSREQIYKRIMQLSEGEEWKYDYEEFVKYDEINRNTASRSAIEPLTEAERREYIKNHRPPTFIKGTWRDAMKNGKSNIVVPLR